MKRYWTLLILVFIFASQAYADEGMWVLKELNKLNLARMQELGFTLSQEDLYNETNPSLSNAVVIFGRGCTGITVSEKGLIFTNHHCGYDAIQQLSSVEHDFLKDGFVSQSMEEEIPVPGLTVRYLEKMVDVSEQINEQIKNAKNEPKRLAMADSLGKELCEAYEKDEFRSANVIPFYNNNKYYLVVYKVFHDVRMVFAPPSSIGKFGGDTDNWMWPRHTGDFSIFRVYADENNQPTEYNEKNRPYHPSYVADISLQGYQEGDYAMTIGFPGRTNRYLCSWGVEQRINALNKPRIAVREVKQRIWKEAMQTSDVIRIKYASKFTNSSNYWKNSIGMNLGISRLKVIERKREEEEAFALWINQSSARKEKYKNVLSLLQQGYTLTNEIQQVSTYLMEAFGNGTEIIRLTQMLQDIDEKGEGVKDIDSFMEEKIKPFFKDYDPTVDQKVLAAMMQIVKDSVPTQYLPDIYDEIDKKHKRDYEKYAKYVFEKTQLLSVNTIKNILENPVKYKKLEKDPAMRLNMSSMISILALQKLITRHQRDINEGERLYFAGLKEMHSNKPLPSDANFTMRLSYGSILSYRPFDAGKYNYYSTETGIFEKENPNDNEFFVQPEILEMFQQKNYGEYANENGNLSLCFLTNNDITGGNSGSPVFNKNGHVIGLAFDGNWEAMSGDIAFEPDLQRCIAVDIRYVLYLIDEWGKCPRLLQEIRIIK